MTSTPERQPAPAEHATGAAKPAGEALRGGTADAVPSRRRSRRSRSPLVVFLNFLLSCVVLAVIAACALAYYGKKQFDAPGPSTEDAVVLVKAKTGTRQIAEDLERRGLIAEPTGLISPVWIFQGGVMLNGAQRQLKPGEYAIPAGASMHDIMDVIRSGKSIEYKVTIPEGFTVEQAWQRIATDPVLVGEMPASLPPEGSLAADTRRFTRGETRQHMVELLAADQARLVEEIWAKRREDLPLKDVNEFVTLASIVEKETGIAAERPRIAAVFINRLRKGMRLQSDPTIIYGLFGGKGKPSDRPIFQSDKEKPTPYNTYVIKGLPPTPIANPGRAALEAVANPAETKDLYFVADGSGGHAFAATLEEHNRNVAKWRALEKEAAAESAGNGSSAQ